MSAQQEHESQLPSRETKSHARDQKAAAVAQARDVTSRDLFGQILSDPDNLDLNFQHARNRIARGDLRSAAATLERMLLIDPSLARVRLLYGVVLFRLDNLDEAERTFNKVREMKIPPSLRNEVDDYLRQIQLRRKRTRFLASLSVGYQFDTNRNASPSSKQRLLSGAVTSVTGTSRKRRDTSVIGIQHVEVTQDIGTQAGHQLFGALDHYLAEQTSADDLDLQSFSAEIGGILKNPWVQFTPSVFTDHIQLSRETFLRTQGVSFLFDRPVTPKLELQGGVRWGREDFTGIHENTSAPERRGDSTSLWGGGSYTLHPRLLATLVGSYTDKDAKTPYQDYDAPGLQTTQTLLLGKGQFLTHAFTFGINRYDDPDHAIVGRTRRDKQYRFRVTYGAPVSLFLGERILPRSFTKDLTLTLTFEQFHSASKIRNYTYSNSKISGMLTKTVQF